MKLPYSILPAKAVRVASRLRGGGGSAMPGLFMEKIDRGFMKRTLEQLPHGVVLVSGTNGKTTTTKMVVELLESQGLKVFTNRTGSNFTRGIAAELIGVVDARGRLDADIAVIELDEAYAVHFVRQVAPRASLLLNVMRDQLDRFGEIDTTAGMLEKVARATTDRVVINREDPRLVRIGESLPEKVVSYYGIAPELSEYFPSDDDMRGNTSTGADDKHDANVTLESIDGKSAKFSIGEKSYETNLLLDGVYNIYNAAGALALVGEILGDETNYDKVLTSLSTIKPAFGRGEILSVNGKPCELVLVKNPSGFRLGLKSFDPNSYATMIAINDNYADGRDMSWLWDVDFESLALEGVVSTSGIRAYDIALRLQYDEVRVGEVIPDLSIALKKLVELDQPRRIYCTYTAMLALRKELAKYTEMERVL